MIIDEALQGSRNGQEEEEPISCSSPGSAPLSSGSAGASPGQRRKESCRDEGPSQSCSSNSTLAAKAEEPCFPPSAPSPSPSPPHTKAMGESCGSNGAEDIAQMLREKDQRIKELEQVISELKREVSVKSSLQFVGLFRWLAGFAFLGSWSASWFLIVLNAIVHKLISAFGFGKKFCSSDTSSVQIVWPSRRKWRQRNSPKHPAKNVHGARCLRMGFTS